jgi:hypothetical protein
MNHPGMLMYVGSSARLNVEAQELEGFFFYQLGFRHLVNFFGREQSFAIMASKLRVAFGHYFCMWIWIRCSVLSS